MPRPNKWFLVEEEPEQLRQYVIGKLDIYEMEEDGFFVGRTRFFPIKAKLPSRLYGILVDDGYGVYKDYRWFPVRYSTEQEREDALAHAINKVKLSEVLDIMTDEDSPYEKNYEFYY